jgi:N6-L-threonylcarbamoyladenine synthase
VRGLILGIESSCDETAAAVVREGREVLSSVIASQVAEHAPYGGVVPEIAGRSHLRAILPTIESALESAHTRMEDLDAIAVTARPGLIGSLLVGLSTAKGLAYSQGLPLVAVDHIEAHAYAAVMESPDEAYPNLTLVVSGGHTALYEARSPTQLQRLAQTRDDSAGEAFDKVAHLLGLPYPGGPSVSKLADQGDPGHIRFPRYRTKSGEPDFSFSGLKTAVLYHLRGQNALATTPRPEEISDRAHVAASFQAAAVDALVRPTLELAVRRGLSTLAVVGGVACNRRLREQMQSKAAGLGIRCLFPSPIYCTDNAAMIAGLGWHLLQAGSTSGLELDASPR